MVQQCGRGPSAGQGAGAENRWLIRAVLSVVRAAAP